MQMWRGDPSGAAYCAHHVAAANFPAGLHESTREMRVIRLHPIAVVHHDQTTVTAAERREDHNTVGRDMHRSSRRRADIDALVELAFARKWILPLAVCAHQPAFHRP